jgi:hypothetical protein
MNFSDEEYVRLYTTDTVTWEMLPWQALALLPLALRKFDRSGVFDFGKHGAERALSTKTKLPVEVVAEALRAILDEEIWQINGTKIYWPTYIEAQNCRRSERLRKRAERAKRPGESADPESSSPCDNCHDSNTKRDICHESSTECDTSHELPRLSQSVTPGQAGRGRGEAGEAGEARNSGSPDPSGAPALPSADESQPPKLPPRPDPMRLAMAPRDTLALDLFSAWQSAAGKPGARLDGKRAALFQRLAAEGVTVEEVERAMMGAKLDTWAVDEAKLGAPQILGSADQREKYIAMLSQPPKKKSIRTPPQPEDTRREYKIRGLND